MPPMQMQTLFGLTTLTEEAAAKEDPPRDSSWLRSSPSEQSLSLEGRDSFLDVSWEDSEVASDYLSESAGSRSSNQHRID